MTIKDKNTLENLEHILDGMNVLICVTEPDTDEVLFVNDHMKKRFGVGNEFIGKKCYKIFRNYDKRCDPCPCDALKKDPESVVEWEDNHPVTNRIYQSYSRYIDWPGGKKVHLEHSIDITDLKNITNILERRLEQQSLMTRISQSFFSGDDMDSLLTNALKEVGEFMGISQVLLYTTTDDEHTIYCQNGWIDPKYNMPSRVGGSIVLSDTMLNIFKSLSNRNKFYITSNDPGIKENMAPYRKNFHNYLTTSIFIEGKLYAALDFSRADETPWNQNEVQMASFTSNILTSVLQKHEMEERIIRAKEAAEKSNRYKSDFLARMSHEIRTPMNAILGITEIQLRDENMSPEMEEGLEKVYDSGNLLLNIINDILDLSKIEAGKLEIVPVRYDIPSLINDTVQINRLRYDSKPIEFFLDVDENTPLNLIGDELRLKQILGNIISNAFKYTEKGEVRMTVFSEKNTQDKNSDDITLVFKISDTGQGMTEDQLNRLFDEYTRFNMDINRTIVGTGLGMSIAKRLLDLMNGSISVVSEVNKGTLFTVQIPQKKIDELVCGKEVAEKLKTFRFQSASISKKSRMLREYMPYGSVLVVDDVASNIYVTKGMLLPYGLKIDTASCGLEAIQKVKAGNVYDVIFMDHMMPNMDGIETTKLIREWEEEQGNSHSPLIIIALTANAIVGQAEVFLKSGFNGYISKPIDSRELNQVLYEFIRNKKPPEVVKAARREQRTAIISENEQSKYCNEVEKFFIMDAESALTILEEIDIKKINNEEVDSYEITVHGMKSALANIGETALSETALKLEKAAINKDFSYMEKETPAFIDALKSLINKLKSSLEKEKKSANVGAKEDIGDIEFLKEKLLKIKTSCETFDPNSAKAALDNLNKKIWQRSVLDILDEINVHLLHSAFKKAAAAAESALETIK